MRKGLLALVLVLSLSLNGCSIIGTVNKDGSAKDKTAQVQAQPIIINDFAGRVVSFKNKPQKIISLSPAVTEILYAMGYGDRITAVSEENVYPDGVKQKSKVGRYADIDIDVVEKTAPDVVFASKYTYRSLASSLEEMNIPVVYAEPETYNGIFDSITMIGKIFGEEKKASEIAESIKQKVVAAREGESTQKPNVLYIQSIDPLFAAGSNTLINDEIWLSGGSNAASELNGYTEARKENIFSKKIDVLIISRALANQGINLDYFKDLEGFKDLDAVKNGKVFVISDEEFMETPGVRIDKAIGEMRSIINK